MKMYGRRMARAAAPVIGALALFATGAVTAPLEAQAAPVGGCACSKPLTVPTGRGMPAFAIKAPGKANHWIYGSFGSANDAPVDGWISGGTWEKALGRFASVRVKDHHKARYYTRYRCVNTRDGDVKRAQSWYTTVKNRGYNFATNNCLHMSMAVFKGYSETLRKDARLKSATRWTPNDYYEQVLPAARWETSQSL